MKKNNCLNQHDNALAACISRKLGRPRRSGRAIARSELFALLLTGVASPCFAQTQWTGAIDDDWFNGDNWSGNTVPVVTDSIEVGAGVAVIRGNEAQSDSSEIGAAGQVTVTDPGSSWNMPSLSLTGGTLEVRAGGAVQLDQFFFDAGTLLIRNVDTDVTLTGDLMVGRAAAAATITIEDGAQLSAARSFVGEGTSTVQSSSLTARVTGMGSTWNAGNFLALGGNATLEVDLTVDDGGQLIVNGTGIIGRGGLGAATVTGAQSALRLNGAPLMVGSFFDGHLGHGRLTVEDGGLVAAGGVWVGGDGVGTTGVFHLNGTPGARGVAAVGYLVKGQGDASVMFDGGILRATQDASYFISGFEDDDLVIDGGGLTIDTAAYTVTASSVLSGPGALEKTSDGTLIFTGANSYAGGTILSGGLLQLGDGGTTGSITGDVVNNAALSFNRSNSMIFSGVISGSGSVHQDGTGTTVLTGINSHAGGTFMNDGILQIAADTALGGVAGGLTFDGGTLNTTANFASARAVNLLGAGTIDTDASTSLTLRGGVFGAGVLTKAGAGTLIVTGDNSHTGGTTITSGILQVGDGGTAGSLPGDVLNEGVLLFNRSDDIVFEGEISGSGSVTQTGAGTLVLSGDNSYAGGTTLMDGMLIVSGDTNLGDVAGGVRFDSGLLQASSSFDSGRDLSVVSSGAVLTDTGVVLALDGVISGSGVLNKHGTGTLILNGDSGAYMGTTRALSGMLLVDGTLGGQLDIASVARLEGTGRVGRLANAGVVAPGGNGFGTLTVTGDYAGQGGTLEIQTVLGGDDSLTDRLVIQGATSGTTGITLINRGGLGAATTEGIKVVDIAGASLGTFTLNGDYLFEDDPAVVAGAYAYRLYRNGITDPADGDWYLRSSLLDPDEPAPPSPPVPTTPLYQPGVPVYEGYAQTLLSLTTLPTLQQRVGNRSWAAASTEGGIGLWGRVEGVRYKPQAQSASSGSQKDIDSWQMQMGLEHTLSQRADGAALVGALTAHYGKASSSLSSVFGQGGIDTLGYGVGATLSWYGAQGFYVDGQAQLGWFSSDLSSGTLGALITNNDGKGQALSIELGQRAPIGGNLSLTPQLQMNYAHTDFDRFVDPVGAVVSADQADRFRTRLGLSLDRQTTSEHHSSHLYGIVNLAYEWLPETGVRVSGAQIINRERTLWGELGLGGSHRWNDRVTFHAQASAQTALGDFGDRYSLRGVIGLRAAF